MLPLKRPSLRRPSGPMIMSTAALVVALGGTSYAAATIGTADIRNDAVTSAKIKNGTIQQRDLTDGARAGLKGQTGAQGPAGPRGPQGLPGAGRWALIGPDGTIQAQSGGFTLVAGYPTLTNTAPEGQPDNSLRANGNVYLNANEELSDNAIVATVVLQNTVDQDGNSNTNGRAGGADQNAEFSGEISVSRCSFTGNTGVPIPTNCAPAGAQNATSFVVSPRLSDGSVTTGAGTTGSLGTRKAFYVVITGDSSDYVAPTAR
ncbi:hypothetical protein [Nocardioides litoris]|uniref:hypothetical protein n=1 Tax=Nocardioides litoris TaxID=1926648 RepID=UPI0011206A2C|nr:hypothetical protein [Nocardioides litoris]